MVNTAYGRCCVKIQLYVHLFNTINAWYVQSFKLAAIFVAVFHGFIGVRFRSYIIIAAFCAVMHFLSCVSYCAVFQKAHQIPRMQRMLKEEIPAAAAVLTVDSARRELLKFSAALRCQGIQVGSFHEIERSSPLIFMDFVEKQVISLLLTF